MLKKALVVDVLGAVESVKAASDIYAPVSGEVVDVNAALEGEPALINGSAFDKGACIPVIMQLISSRMSTQAGSPRLNSPMPLSSRA